MGVVHWSIRNSQNWVWSQNLKSLHFQTQKSPFILWATETLVNIFYVNQQCHFSQCLCLCHYFCLEPSFQDSSPGYASSSLENIIYPGSLLYLPLHLPDYELCLTMDWSYTSMAEPRNPVRNLPYFPLDTQPSPIDYSKTEGEEKGKNTRKGVFQIGTLNRVEVYRGNGFKHDNVRCLKKSLP